MKIPQEVQNILGVFRVFGDKIYLAGGAVRNHLFDLPIKDYDLCLLSKDVPMDIKELNILADRLQMTIQVYDNYGEYNQLPWHVVKLTKQDLMVDVLICNNHVDIEHVIGSFACNASMVYLDEKGHYKSNAKFNRFEDTRTLEFYEASEDYKQRMRAYFENTNV